MVSERTRPNQGMGEALIGKKEIPEVPYIEFLSTNNAEVGEMITGVKPGDLYTYQDWIEDEKVANVLGYVSDNSPLLESIQGYLRYHTKFEKNVIVIGNGNHRGLWALINGRRVNVKIETPVIEHKDNPFRLSNLLNKYGDPFSSS